MKCRAGQPCFKVNGHGDLAPAPPPRCTTGQHAVQLLDTLFVGTPGSDLRLDNVTMQVDVEQEARLRVVLRHWQEVMGSGPAGL